MSEVQHGANQDPRQQLVSLLQTDYTPQDRAASPPADSDNAFHSFLARARPVEDIDARFASEESIQLGQTVETLLEPAPVTTSFKGFIAQAVRKAHAWRAKVDNAVSPDRLGLLSGQGIFDPVQAREIEVQTLRGRMFDLLHRYTIAPDTDIEAETGVPKLLLRPGVRPNDYAEGVARLDEWTADYQRTYGEDPFDGLEPDAYQDAAPKAHATGRDRFFEPLESILERLRADEEN
jgi:hypothetical protein